MSPLSDSTQVIEGKAAPQINTPRPDRGLTKEIETDPELAALLVLWDRLPEGGRKLLRQTAETLAGALPTRHKRKRRDQ